MDFVDFNLARKLKEKGFREKCFATYSSYGGIFKFNEIDTDKIVGNLNIKDFGKCYNCYEKGSNIDAPTIPQVLKRLRDEFSFHISTKPYLCEDGLMWMYEVRKFKPHIIFVVANKKGFTEEKLATLAGIEYVLNLIESWNLYHLK